MEERARDEINKAGQTAPSKPEVSTQNKPTNVANDPGIKLETERDMEKNVDVHCNDLKTAVSEEEDTDIKAVLNGDDLPTASEVSQGVYIFRSREDFVCGFFVQGPNGRVKVRAKFEGSSFTLTDDLCDIYGVTIKEFVKGMIKNDRQNIRYMLVSGPGIVRTEAMEAFDKRSQAATNRRDAKVTQGPRSSGR